MRESAGESGDPKLLLPLSGPPYKTTARPISKDTYRRQQERPSPYFSDPPPRLRRVPTPSPPVFPKSNKTHTQIHTSQQHGLSSTSASGSRLRQRAPSPSTLVRRHVATNPAVEGAVATDDDEG